MCLENNAVNQIEIKCVAEVGAVLPTYETVGSAGADIRAFLSESVTIKPLERAMIPTGLKFEIPLGYEMQIRPRSGLAAKNGVTLVNAPGTIDSDYRGEVKIILINLGKEDFIVNNGDRIAQAVIAPVTQGLFSVATELSQTSRGEGGFGSTGKN